MGDAVMLWRRMQLHTTIKIFFPLCHWIPHNILFHPRRFKLSSYGWIIDEAAFFFFPFLISVFPRAS
jgi:hypothetical protein